MSETLLFTVALSFMGYQLGKWATIKTLNKLFGKRARKYKMKLNPPQTAPKNMDVFLALFESYPYLVSTTWNPHDQCWVYTQMKCNMMSGEYTDPYFETEYTRETAIIGWLPMPEFEQ